MCTMRYAVDLLVVLSGLYRIGLHFNFIVITICPFESFDGHKSSIISSINPVLETPESIHIGGFQVI